MGASSLRRSSVPVPDEPVVTIQTRRELAVGIRANGPEVSIEVDDRDAVLAKACELGGRASWSDRRSRGRRPGLPAGPPETWWRHQIVVTAALLTNRLTRTPLGHGGNPNTVTHGRRRLTLEVGRGETGMACEPFSGHQP